jgi:hypothetical protein
VEILGHFLLLWHGFESWAMGCRIACRIASTIIGPQRIIDTSIGCDHAFKPSLRSVSIIRIRLAAMDSGLIWCVGTGQNSALKDLGRVRRLFYLYQNADFGGKSY